MEIETIDEADCALGVGAGACALSAPILTSGAAAVDGGEDSVGERAGAPAGVIDKAQLAAEEAETLQAEGRDKALVTFKTTPS